VNWLRSQYDFPVRVPVYLLPGPTFFTIDEEEVVASFFAPWDPKAEPYIRLATGDFPSLKDERGRDAALTAILASLARQVARYQNWVETGKLSDHGIARRARSIMRRYESSTDRP
jgi:hypothetical protein